MSRRKTKNTTTNAALNTSISPCIICLDEVRCRGKITSCDHWFCFSCILEWSKNTNTCPICKARFRTISKVHLSPMKSPPSKVRVPDKDQRVWNDDDDVVMEDFINDLQNDMRDAMDEDYEPPSNDASSWTRAHSQESDDYELEDSFIDDSTVSMTIRYEQHIRVEIGSDDEQEHGWMRRENPYPLRRSAGRESRQADDAVTVTNPDELLLELENPSSTEQASDDDSISTSVVSAGSFIVNDGLVDDVDDDDNDWSDTQDFQRSPTRTRATSSRPSSRTSSRTPTIRASSSTRSSWKRTTKSPKNTRRNASRAIKSAKKQAAKKRREQEYTVSKNIRETAESSGWLSTTRRPERASAVTAAHVIAQTANESPCRTNQSSRINPTTRELQRQEVDTDDTDEDVQIVATTSTNTRNHKISRARQKDTSRVQFSKAQRRHYESDDSYDGTKVVTTRKSKSHDRLTRARSMQSIENRPHYNPTTRDLQRQEVDTDDTDQDVQIAATTSTNTRNHKISRARQKDTSRVWFSKVQRRHYESDDSYDGTKIVTTKKSKSHDRSTRATSMQSIGNRPNIANIQGEKGKGALKRKKGKENEPLQISSRSERTIPRKRTKLHQQAIDNYIPLGLSSGRETHTNRHSNASTSYNNHNNHRVSAGPPTRSRCHDNDDDYTDENSARHNPSTSRIIHNNRPGPSTRSRYHDNDDDYTDENSARHNPSTSRIIHNNRPGPSTRSRYHDKDDDDDDYTDEDSSTRNPSTSRMNHNNRPGPSTHCYDNNNDDDDCDDYSMNNNDVDDDSDVNNKKDKDTSSDDTIVEDEAASVLLPTPQDGKKQSLFTRRRHKPMPKCFDDDSDGERKNSTRSKHNHQPSIPKKSHSNLCNPTKPCNVESQGCSSTSIIDKPRVGKARRRIQVFESDSE